MIIIKTDTVYRGIFIAILFSLLTPVRGRTQFATQSALPGYTYHPMKEDKPSWQRLSMLLGATFLVVAKEGQVDIDSCLQVASRSMGVSRFSLLGEGIADPELAEKSAWIDLKDPAKAIRLLGAARGKERLELLLLLGAYYAFEPHNYSKHKDSVEYFLNQVIAESKLLKEGKLGRQAMVLLVKMYALGNDPKAKSVCDVLITQCKLVGDKDTEARALAYRSKFTPPMGSTIQQKIDDAQTAAELYESIGNIEGAINALTDLGYLQIILAQLDASYINLVKAMKLAESIGFPYTHYNGQALATVTIFQGKFGEPLRYIYQLIRTSEATRDSLAWSYFYSNMSAMLDAEGRFDESLKWAQKSASRFAEDRNPSVYRALDLVAVYMLNREPQKALDMALEISKKVGYPTTITDQFSYHLLFADCYTALNMLPQAEMHINRMDELETAAEAIRGPMRRSEVNVARAYLATQRKDYVKAKEYFEKQFTSPGGMDRSLSVNIAGYNAILMIDSILGDNVAAVGHYKRYVKLLDSTFRISKIRQAEELQVLYQIHEKESQITSLTQEAKLEKANSEKAALVRNLTIAGIIAAMIIAGLLYRQNRLRKKNNELITQKNEELQQLVNDKEWLLKEIHHRVKNNLQIIMSLLDSQSEYINNEAALIAIEDNLRRVHAMALIHQKLYQSDDISSIAMREYIDELVIYARESFDTANRICFEQNIESLDLDVAQAIPLGLIINESIVNAIKYAFPNGRKGAVNIELYKEPDDHLVLKISDDGTGLPAGINAKAHTSLGFDLMQGLTKQLNGTFNIESNGGLHITIRFMMLNSLFSHKAMVNF